MTRPDVVVHATAEVLAAATAARLITRIVDVQSASGSASLVLTGGRIGIAVLREVANTPAATAVDWRQLDIYWGDERFLPRGHPERNETQAREALLDHVDMDPARVFPMGASDGPWGNDPDAAARTYEEQLLNQRRPEDRGVAPSFDICLLGVGEDGHVASVFPGSPAVYETERAVIAVRGSPKPPPIRITLTQPAIRCAAEVWLIVSGSDKAAAVAMALGGAGQVSVPAAGATGRRRTLWLLDRAAAAKLPPELLPR
ncbi:MAG: 6-phosphogluconolactonase [Pseudonocardiales bacterium]|nr:6-phosphogluconolactonase [Pseudonocardiales bacterium]MBV9651460.1 6-phosphogluconolactonase [Pseudonocardiales bacterium]